MVKDDQFRFQSELVRGQKMAVKLLFVISLAVSSFDPSVRVCLCVRSHRSIPGLKLVPPRSPNGSIDHCSVPFSNQRTAVVVSSTQEMTHFNEESVIILSLQREREGRREKKNWVKPKCKIEGKHTMIDCWN